MTPSRGPGARRACSAVVLAGGRSTRFGRDKLAEIVDGRPLLDHAIEAVGAVASEVIVVASPQGSPSTGSGAPFVVVHDPESFGGPLVALLEGLRAARRPVAIVVGGDMPGLVPAVLAMMVDRLSATDADAVALDDDGRTRPLPIAVWVRAAATAAESARTHGARSLHALLDRLRVDMITGDEWRSVDPEGATLRDVDRPGDLGPDATRGQPPRPSAS